MSLFGHSANSATGFARLRRRRSAASAWPCAALEAARAGLQEPRKRYPGERHTPTPATNVVDISHEPCKEPAAETGAKSAAGHGDHNERGQVSTLAITRAAYSAAGPGLARGRQSVGFLGQACGFGGEVGAIERIAGLLGPHRALPLFEPFIAVMAFASSRTWS